METLRQRIIGIYHPGDVLAPLPYHRILSELGEGVDAAKVGLVLDDLVGDGILTTMRFASGTWVIWLVKILKGGNKKKINMGLINTFILSCPFFSLF